MAKEPKLKPVDAATQTEAAIAPVPEVEQDGAAQEGAPAASFVVTITCAQHRRRAGFAFGPTPTHLTSEQLTPEIQDVLLADPMLVIRPYRHQE